MTSHHDDSLCNVTELVFFAGHRANDAEAAALDIVRKLDGCERYWNCSLAQVCPPLLVNGFPIGCITERRSGRNRTASGYKVRNTQRTCVKLELSCGIDWLSLGHHRAFQKSAIYEPFVAGASSFTDEVAKIVHVCFTPYPTDRAFGCPVTEMLTVSSPQKVIAEKFMEAFVSLASGKGAVGIAYGATLEDDKEHVCVYGWKERKVSGGSLQFEV